EVGVEAGPLTLVVRRSKAGEAGVHAALERAACLHFVQRRGRRRAAGQGDRCRAQNSQYPFVHTQTLFCFQGPPWFSFPCGSGSSVPIRSGTCTSVGALASLPFTAAIEGHYFASVKSEWRAAGATGPPAGMPRRFSARGVCVRCRPRSRRGAA